MKIHCDDKLIDHIKTALPKLKMKMDEPSKYNYINGGGGINSPENYKRFYLDALVQAKCSGIFK